MKNSISLTAEPGAPFCEYCERKEGDVCDVINCPHDPRRTPEPSVDYARGLEDVAKKYHAEGRAEGLEEGARVCENYTTLVVPFMLKNVAAAIRAKIKPRTDEREGK